MQKRNLIKFSNYKHPQQTLYELFRVKPDQVSVRPVQWKLKNNVDGN